MYIMTEEEVQEAIYSIGRMAELEKCSRSEIVIRFWMRREALVREIESQRLVMERHAGSSTPNGLRLYNEAAHVIDLCIERLGYVPDTNRR